MAIAGRVVVCQKIIYTFKEQKTGNALAKHEYAKRYIKHNNRNINSDLLMCVLIIYKLHCNIYERYPQLKISTS